MPIDPKGVRTIQNRKWSLSECRLEMILPVGFRSVCKKNYGACGVIYFVETQNYFFDWQVLPQICILKKSLSQRSDVKCRSSIIGKTEMKNFRKFDFPYQLQPHYKKFHFAKKRNGKDCSKSFGGGGSSQKINWPGEAAPIYANLKRFCRRSWSCLMRI